MTSIEEDDTYNKIIAEILTYYFSSLPQCSVQSLFNTIDMMSPVYRSILL